ncbi:MAG: hypothetical protein M1611_02265 [Candidatus Marsarchaeota archaeon]|nr:hypothetical protein [Candidatus Marsarchaeota archaeon]
MKGISAFVLVFSAWAMFAVSHAYYNVTYVNVTVSLNSNQSAHVVENYDLYISNTSINQYVQTRSAIDLTLNYWQNMIGTTNLREHLTSPNSSIYGFKFLPGPFVPSKNGNGGYALLTMDYYINNATSVRDIAPRKFEYTFNDSVLDFNHTGSGEILQYDTRLNIIIPGDSYAVSVYPLPDMPAPNFLGNYSNVTEFSWFQGEPLTDFSFSYITTESMEAEVLNYFTNLYRDYTTPIYSFGILVLIAMILYAYIKSSEIMRGGRKRK